ncbi:MAG: glycosyltransferase family 9 protein [Ignavibacterium sp.]
MIKKIEQSFRKALLKFLLLFSKQKNTESKLPSITSDTKVLFVRLNRIGDALVSTPLIDLVKSKTGCKVFVLADKKNHFVFSNNPNIDKVIVFEKGFKGFLSVLKFIKEQQIDIIVDLHDDVSTTVSYLFALANAKYKFGLQKQNKDFYTHTVLRIDSRKEHVIDRLLKLSELFDIQYEKREIKIGYYPKKENLIEAEKIIAQKFSNKRFLLGINISAGSDARFWGIENYKSLLQLLKNYDINILLFSDLKDYHTAQSIADDNSIYPLSKDFDKFAAGILQIDLLFSPDTSAIHIASIKKIPVFGLYVKYKTQDMIWSPYNTDFDCIITEEPSLKNIKVEDVTKKFIPFLEKYIYAQRNTKL